MRRLSLILPLLAACTMSTVPAKQTHDAALRSALQNYVVGFLRINPSVNTYLGGAGLDPSLREVNGRLRDDSPDALSGEDRWLTQMEESIESIDPKTVSTAARIDRDVALAQIRYQINLHQVRRYQQRSVDTYTDEPFRAVDFQLQGMTQTGANTYGTPEEWSLVIDRVSAIPWFLANAEQQLRNGVAANNTPDFRMLFRNGIGTAESDAQYFESTLPQLGVERISGARREELAGAVRAAGVRASAAYRHFRDFVASTFFDDASRETSVKPQFGGDRFVMGEQEYNWALRNNLRVDRTAAQLYEEAWPIVEQTQRDMIALARQIGANHRDWPMPADGNAAVRFVFDQLAKDYPKSDAEMIAWYRDAGVRLVDYGRRTGIFDVPADYKLDVVETPAPLQSSIDGAAYYPAPPFMDSGVGRFYVSPTGNDAALLRENNRSALADLAAHEGFPGHDWYFKVLIADREHISPVRWLTPGAVEDSSSMWEDSMSSEGWGLYSEALMAEPQPGAPTGFYTPEERLYQLQGKLYRDLRVRVDTGLHTGRLKYDDAVDLFSRSVDFQPGSCRDANLLASNEGKRASCRNAENAIFRYSKWPTQAITYRLGKDAIYALRSQAAQQMGSKFDLKRFHLLFIRQGTIPPDYFGDEVLRSLR